MKRNLVIGTVIVVAAFLFASLAWANHGDYHLDWWTVDGGGTSTLESGDGTYALSGTAGQPDASTLTSGDGSYTLAGGFWGDAGSSQTVYLPVVIRE